MGLIARCERRAFHFESSVDVTQPYFNPSTSCRDQYHGCRSRLLSRHGVGSIWGLIDMGAQSVAQRASRRPRFSSGVLVLLSDGYSTETRMTPDLIIPSRRAALTETSMTRPRMKGPRSLIRHCIVCPACVTVTILPKGRVR
jgi:hypothetical protein